MDAHLVHMLIIPFKLIKSLQIMLPFNFNIDLAKVNKNFNLKLRNCMHLTFVVICAKKIIVKEMFDVRKYSSKMNLF